MVNGYLVYKPRDKDPSEDDHEIIGWFASSFTSQKIDNGCYFIICSPEIIESIQFYLEMFLPDWAFRRTPERVAEEVKAA